ncbi:hypothetical protein B0H63DRAFT_216863 [Podospora didyma]|uniref:BZIP domain-containing protein n=1 Tax=Podospora didyma TaxID=330526 RepID=A0AAE0NI68_9PEZI|nr:hypothetical protein B0H63DRAFT_216863 [Podospora didyma]
MAEDQRQEPVSSAAARVRENQRRSRARHREFVEGLQIRIKEYERRGVEATLEMQRTARAVALENSRLRALLVSRGVSPNEIENFLSSFDDQLAHIMGDAPTTTTTVALPAQARCGPKPRRLSRNGNGSVDIRATRSRRSIDAAATMCHGMTDADHTEDDRFQSDDTIPMSDEPALFSDRNQEQTSSSGPFSSYSSSDTKDGLMTFTPQRHSRWQTERSTSPSLSPTASGSPMEMSCTIAASIIVSMQRGQTETRAREALGCKGTRDCLVKNTAVFQFLDG